MKVKSISSVLFRFFTAFAMVAVILAVLQPTPARAATITVATTSDETTTNGSCSLREAIINANNDLATQPDCPTGSGADTIVLASGSTYLLTLAGNTATTGDLDITDADGLTIQGNGATIDANDIERVIDVTAGNLTVDTLTITNGTTPALSPTGGGIRFAGTGTLTVTNSTISNNVGVDTAGCGGGIYNNSTATINIINSTIANNTCTNATGDGGGIWKGTGGDLNITNSIISGNSTGDQGGGIRFSGGGALTITDSTISGNSSTSTAACGGGIFNNSAATIGITGSTIANNTCTGIGSDGGGLWKGAGGTLNITNSTFYGNSTNNNGGGARITAGTTATILFSTFANNSTAGGVGNNGGGLQITGAATTVDVISSILANNTPHDCDISPALPTVTLNNTLVEVDIDCGTESFTSDAGIGVLGNNGGPTQTVSITSASQAFNAATSCGSLTADQRVSPRPQKSTDNCDLGAFELQVNDEPTFTPGTDVTVLEDSGAYSTGWATAMDDGDSELTQTLTFNVSNNNNALFSVQPAIDSGGTLTFTPAANANGSATVSVFLSDDGGTANGGDDTSPTVNFTITVTAVNDEPVFTPGGNVTVAEDSGAYSAGWATGIDDGDPEVVQTLTFNVSNDNNALFAVQPAIDSGGTLTFTPVANANGFATVSVYLTDDGGTVNGGDDTSPTVTFTITVTAVDDPPTDIALVPASVAENLPVNTVIGALSATDPDIGDTHTFSLVTNLAVCPLAVDNASFNISGNNLQTSASFDFETQSSYVICIRATDSTNLTYDEQTTVTITDVNEAPTDIALSPSSVAENQPVNTVVGALSTTDVDAGDSHTYSLVVNLVACPAAVDNASFNISGSNLQTSAIFDFETQNSYVICIQTTDSGALTFDKQFAVTVTNVNDPPVITEGTSVTVNMSEDGSPTPFSLTLNATDQDGDTITWSISGPASNGTASASGTGASKAIGYTPNPNYTGTDSFDVQVSDGNGGFDTITVNVNIGAVNDPPAFVETDPVAVTMDEDGSPTPFSLTLNATDPEGNTITWSISSQGGNGTATAGGTGNSKTIGYSPNANYNGSDSFVVQIDDGNGGTATITVNVTINPVNDPPVIVEGTSITVNMSEDGSPTPFSLTLNAVDVDGDTIMWSISSPASNGTASASGTGNSKAIGYTPNLNYNGTDAFDAQISDGNGGTDTITINVNVGAQGDPPVFVENDPVAVTMDEDGSPTPFSLTLNATDPDGDTITWSISGAASNGTASASGTGNSKAIGYSPNVDYNGSDSFVVQIDDGNGNTASLTVNVTINPVNDAPVNSVPGVQTAQENGSLAFSSGNGNLISTSDVDAGSGLLQVTLTVTNGTLTLSSTSGLSSLSGNGTASVSFQGNLANVNNALAGMVYAPTFGYVGADAIQIVANDQGNTGSGGALSDTDVVIITVTNTPPKVVVDGVNTSADTGDGKLDENEVASVAITQLIVRFDQDLFNPNVTDPDSATNPANYLLINDNGDGFQTTNCLAGLAAGDAAVVITSVSYSNGGGAGPFVVTLNLASALSNGTYRLIVCGTTSITDLTGLALAGDGSSAGTDFIRNFSVFQTTGRDRSGTQKLAAPATGFPMHQVTTLPSQPADKAYAATDLWLEIPRLGMKMSIVGVPQTKDGWDVTWLDRNAGWLNGSAFPTWKGNSVITAHVWDALNRPGPFAQLKDLKYGDQVRIHAFGQVYLYEIRASTLISPNDTAAMLKHEEKSWLTLITCEDYREASNTYASRRMVRAVLVSVTNEK